jgi:hypothetical protein
MSGTNLAVTYFYLNDCYNDVHTDDQGGHFFLLTWTPDRTESTKKLDLLLSRSALVRIFELHSYCCIL